ncbi:nutritionally-regulated adipose and cardiac enriched protein homolog [Dasypus novemcinctus]|uniref:nutritionally-regulated adipose and cardiac enriched protein homolog n=1 Tax=Dasypus novemcinctus TaxID=9361 RepID=UPI00265E0E37|nr:nutritionally-regulated adipose and cardiac enriched protein homolog isoform X2 [Dasypus novemcinctus]XP_058146955.1 nutritionally-regulated adipose and cardiac enriched protein homolog isoform X2 [Dasypus novemcinctus]XP_058146961.1 nutritionally-regulated adipose and cardiac enriched protein homolog isoform X2 [Dasypus novemcinctus]
MRTAAPTPSPDSSPQTQPRARKEKEGPGGAPGPGRDGGSRRPPSILRRSRPGGRRAEPRGSRRRVRFQEPLEAAVHYIARREAPPTLRAPVRPAPRGALRLCACVLLALALGLCCSRAEPVALALEELRARLRALALHLRRAALACWHRLRPH